MINQDLYDQYNDVVVHDLPPSKSRPPWIRAIGYKHKNQRMVLSKEICDFAKYIELTKEEKEIRYLILRKLTFLVQKLLPESDVILHGSSASNTAMPKGDLDFLIVSRTKSMSIGDILDQLCFQLVNVYSFLLPISCVRHNARVPIIAGVESTFGFNIDISISEESVHSFNGLLNIQRTRSLLSTYHSLFPLLMVLKHFLRVNSLDSPYEGGISSTVLMQMIVYIIQSAPNNCKENVGELLLGFFNTFGYCYNYIECQISTINGGRIIKKGYSKDKDFNSSFSIVVEDPQHPGMFISSNNKKHQVFFQKCGKANQLLKMKYNEFESMLMRIFKDFSIIENERNEVFKQYLKIMKIPIPLNTPEQSDSRKEAISHFISGFIESQRDKITREIENSSDWVLKEWRSPHMALQQLRENEHVPSVPATQKAPKPDKEETEILNEKILLKTIININNL